LSEVSAQLLMFDVVFMKLIISRFSIEKAAAGNQANYFGRMYNICLIQVQCVHIQRKKHWVTWKKDHT